MNRSVRLHGVYGVIVCLLMVMQPMRAEEGAKVQEKRSSLVKKVTARRLGLVALGAWCCGVTYWCFKMQQSLRESGEKLAHERDVRKRLEKDINSLTITKNEQETKLFLVSSKMIELQELVKTLEGSIDTFSKDFQPVRRVVYGTAITENQRIQRLQILAEVFKNPEQDQEESVAGSDDESPVASPSQAEDSAQNVSQASSGGWWPFGFK